MAKNFHGKFFLFKIAKFENNYGTRMRDIQFTNWWNTLIFGQI